MRSPSLLQRLARKADKTLASLFHIDQWVILTGRGMGYLELDWGRLRPLLPPTDRYWGDPFVISKDDCYYLFIEEKLYATGLGRIACLTLDGRDGCKNRTGHHFISSMSGSTHVLSNSGFCGP